MFVENFNLASIDSSRAADIQIDAETYSNQLKMRGVQPKNSIYREDIEREAITRKSGKGWSPMEAEWWFRNVTMTVPHTSKKMHNNIWINNVYVYGYRAGGGWADSVKGNKLEWAKVAQAALDSHPEYDHVIYYYESEFNSSDIPMSVFFDIIGLTDEEFVQRTKNSSSQYVIYAVHRKD